MPPAYSTTQKNAIAQFTSVTGADRNAAAKFLKNANWNINVATNNYFGAPRAQSSPALKTLFEKYRAKGGDSEIMDLTATQKYFADIGVNLEDASSLIASQVVQCPALGEVTREGFVNGWGEVGAESISQQKQYIKDSLSTLGSPNQAPLLEKVYKHTFSLMMQNQGQRSADKATCVAFWELLFAAPSLEWNTDNVAWRTEWIEFISNISSAKGISRDQWNHVLKFAKLSLEDESLSFHSDEQSWPSVIDEFAEHMRKKLPSGGQRGEEEMEL